MEKTKTNGEESNYQLTSKELMRFIRSKEFRFKLAESSLHTMMTGYECGFQLFRDFENNLDYWTPIHTGNSEETRSDDQWLQDNVPYWPNNTGDFVLDLHFHPEYDEALDISEADLRHLDGQSEKYLTRPIVGVGWIDTHGHGAVGFMQKAAHFMMAESDYLHVKDLYDSYYDQLSLSWSEEEFKKQMELSGLVRAEVLNFHINDFLEQTVKMSNPEVIGRFAYSLRPDSFIKQAPDTL